MMMVIAFIAVSQSIRWDFVVLGTVPIPSPCDVVLMISFVSEVALKLGRSASAAKAVRDS